jgi:Flp pilus assembly protein TadD
VIKAFLPILPRRNQRILDQADIARNAKNFRKAALLYERALVSMPDDVAIHIQCGHMHKEASQADSASPAEDLARAEYHYNCAKPLTPDDPDLALQLGHFYKVAGRLEEAELAYREAMGIVNLCGCDRGDMRSLG